MCLLFLSPHFNLHFPGEPGLLGTRMSPFWMLLELTMMEVMVLTTKAMRNAKLQSNHNHQPAVVSFLWTVRPSCRQTNSQQCQH